MRNTFAICNATHVSAHPSSLINVTSWFQRPSPAGFSVLGQRVSASAAIWFRRTPLAGFGVRHQRASAYSASGFSASSASGFRFGYATHGGEREESKSLQDFDGVDMSDWSCLCIHLLEVFSVFAGCRGLKPHHLAIRQRPKTGHRALAQVPCTGKCAVVLCIFVDVQGCQHCYPSHQGCMCLVLV